MKAAATGQVGWLVKDTVHTQSCHLIRIPRHRISAQSHARSSGLRPLPVAGPRILDAGCRWPPPSTRPPTMQNWHRIVGDHVDFRRRHSLASPLSLCPLPRRLANFLGRCVRSCATQISLHMTLHCNWVRPDSGLVGSVCLYSRKAMAHETPRCVSPRLRWPISGQDLLPSGLADRRPRCGLNCLRRPNIVEGGHRPQALRRWCS